MESRLPALADDPGGHHGSAWNRADFRDSFGDSPTRTKRVYTSRHLRNIIHAASPSPGLPTARAE